MSAADLGHQQTTAGIIGVDDHHLHPGRGGEVHKPLGITLRAAPIVEVVRLEGSDNADPGRVLQEGPVRLIGFDHENVSLP